MMLRSTCCSGAGCSSVSVPSGSASAVAGINWEPTATTARAAIVNHPRLVELMAFDITTLNRQDVIHRYVRYAFRWQRGHHTDVRPPKRPRDSRDPQRGQL